MPKINLEVLRELTLEDLTAATQRPSVVARGPGLAQVRAIHHAQARMLAAGTKPGPVAAALGVSRVVLEQLQEDPTFQELVGYYREQLDEVYLSTHEKASLLARLAMDELQERLTTTPSRFSENQLRELTIAMLDRTDLPVKTGQAQAVAAPTITFNFGGLPGRPQLESQVVEGQLVEAVV